MKFKLDNKSFEIKNAKLKGYAGAEILSQINDYKTSCTLDITNANNVEMIKLCQKAGVKLSDLTSDDTALQTEAQNKIAKLIDSDANLIFSLFGKAGDSKILFGVMDSILEYYKQSEDINVDITGDDFTKPDIIEVIKFLKKEPKNEIQDFLGLSDAESNQQIQNLASEIVV
jgi:hypothetical protein